MLERGWGEKEKLPFKLFSNPFMSGILPTERHLAEGIDIKKKMTKILLSLYCQTLVFGLGLGVDFTFLTNNNNKKKKKKNPHLISQLLLTRF